MFVAIKSLKGTEFHRQLHCLAPYRCGYENWAINRMLQLRNKDSKPTNTSNTTTTRGTSTVIPYHGELSQKLSWVFKDYNISTHFKPTDTIRQALAHPKDKHPKGLVSGVVYGIQCSETFDCDFFTRNAMSVHSVSISFWLSRFNFQLLFTNPDECEFTY